MKKIVLGIFILIMLTVMYTSTDSVYAIHLTPELSSEFGDVFTINAEPLDESTILLTGHAPRAAREPVEIKVTAPNGNLVSIDQLTVDSNFNYMTEIKTSAKSWNVNGAYVITAHQGPGWLHNFVSTNVEVVGGLLADFKLDYQIVGGFVSYIEVEPNSNSLIISINTNIYDDTSEGRVLTIELPRKVIEAKIMDTDIDDQLVVFVDGVNTQFEVVVSSSVRSLTIPFISGSEEIKVTGTYVDPGFAISIIPEFGILAPLVLSVSIAAIIAFSLKGKFSILYPKQ
ncbi:MAG: hypothetical protein IIA82_08250 [Thaumarchaeota archaeon]|nr:hypothetical protein [Nitrososphaerota archaeon]